jgi:hypothetical protein
LALDPMMDKNRRHAHQIAARDPLPFRPISIIAIVVAVREPVGSAMAEMRRWGFRVAGDCTAHCAFLTLSVDLKFEVVNCDVVFHGLVLKLPTTATGLRLTAGLASHWTECVAVGIMQLATSVRIRKSGAWSREVIGARKPILCGGIACTI